MRSATLEELCEINVGRTPARAAPQFWGAGEPWLSIADMNQGHVITTTKEQITPAGAKSGRLVEPGTVLLSFKLSIGKVVIAGIPLYTNEAIAALPIRDRDVLDEQYLVRALAALDLTGGANRAAMGATLNKAKLKGIRIPLPALHEQRRIAAILDHADALRAKRRQVVAHLDVLSQSLYKEMFATAAVPVRLLGDLIADQRIGLDRGAKAQGPGRMHEYVKMDAITRNGKLDLTKLTRVDANVAEVSKYTLVDGDLILNTRNSKELVGKTAVYRGQPRLYNNNLMRLRFSDELTPDYVHQYFWSREGRQQLDRRKSGTTSVFAIYAKSLATIEIPVPPGEAQRTFAQRLQQIRAQNGVLQQGLAADDELFASLQSRAFKGEL